MKNKSYILDLVVSAFKTLHILERMDGVNNLKQGSKLRKNKYDTTK
jgi:hypothetical protein